MDYEESLILHSVMVDRQQRSTKAYRGLTAREIADRTKLGQGTLSKKLTRGGRVDPELRQEDPYPYLDKKGNRYLLNKRTQEHLILDARHCRIFLRAMKLWKANHQALSKDELVEDCSKQLDMDQQYIKETIDDLLKRGYLVKDNSRSGDEWYDPSETDYAQERTYYGFLLGVLEPVALDKLEKKRGREQATQLQRLDDELEEAVAPRRSGKR